MEVERAKGTKEVEPKEKVVMNNILKVITRNLELYGFQPLETPILQRYDVLAGKYAGGAEILKETFKLKDQGKRQLSLRYDLTVPLAIYVSLNPQVKIPFKRYEIGKIFRDGPISSQRFRELWQCDADTIGSPSMLADAEIIQMTFKIFKNLKLDIKVKVNNRKILDAVIKYSNIKENMIESVILTIDKLDKIGIEGLKKELKDKKITKIQTAKLLEILTIKGNNETKLKKLKETIGENEGTTEIEELLKYSQNATLDLALARGLSYYTGTIFECFLENSEINTAVASGGRYDKMIGKMLDNKQEYPAVGISFGLNRIAQAKKTEEKTNIKCFVISIGTQKETQKLANELREQGIETAIDIIGRGVSKNLDYANSLEIPYVIFLGENELKQGKYKLRNMETGKEEMLDLNGLIKVLK